MTMVMQVLLVLVLQMPGAQEPSYREVPMKSIEQCLESVAHALEQAQERRDGIGTVYVAGCKIAVVQERGA